MEKEEVKKIRQQALNDARNRTGARKDRIRHNPRENGMLFKQVLLVK